MTTTGEDMSMAPVTGDEALLSLGEVAQRFGVKPRVISYWARTGFLNEAARTPGGHRRWRETDVTRALGRPGEWPGGNRRRQDVSTAGIVRMREAGNMTWEAIGREPGIAASTARDRYQDDRTHGAPGNGQQRHGQARRSRRAAAPAGSAGPVLLDPSDWPALTSGQLTAFTEAIHTLLDCGIFRPPLAAELVRYRDDAAAEIGARIAGELRGPPEDVIGRTDLPG